MKCINLTVLIVQMNAICACVHLRVSQLSPGMYVAIDVRKERRKIAFHGHQSYILRSLTTKFRGDEKDDVSLKQNTRGSFLMSLHKKIGIISGLAKILKVHRPPLTNYWRVLCLTCTDFSKYHFS